MFVKVTVQNQVASCPARHFFIQKPTNRSSIWVEKRARVNAKSLVGSALLGIMGAAIKIIADGPDEQQV